MIGYLSGVVLDRSTKSALLDIQGVGYEVHLSERLVQNLVVGQRAAFYIFTHLRADGRSEGALELFGFSTPWEKDVFLALTSVSGMGFRTALAALGALPPESILGAIVKQDRMTLTSAPGIGKKTAERLIIELSEKAQALLAQRRSPQSKGAVVQQSPIQEDPSLELWQEAQGALTALGYKDFEISAALKKVYQDAQGQDLTTPTFITKALKILGRGASL